MSDSKKVRYAIVYDDPCLDKDLIGVKYSDTTRTFDYLTLYNPEDGRRECEILDTHYVGGWKTYEEAKEWFVENVDITQYNQSEKSETTGDNQ